jgi:integrase
VKAYPAKNAIPQVAHMRTDRYDPVRRLWYYRLHYWVRGRSRSLNRWFPSDLEAWRFVLEDRGEAAEARAALTWQACLDVWRKAKTRTEDHVLRVERSVALMSERHPAPPGKLSSEALSAFLASQSPGAARKHLRNLKAVVRAVEGTGVRVAAPWERLRAPAYKTSRRQAVRPEDLPRLLAALPEDLRLLATWVALTGCRQGAACRILASDVQDGRVVLREKADAAPDYVLDADLQAVVDEAMAFRRRVKTRSDRLFVTAQGRAWNPMAVSHRVHDHWPAGLTMHGLRHMWGTGIAALGLGADLVQAALGHRSRASSIPYVHVAEDSKTRATAQQALRAPLAAILRSRIVAGNHPTQGQTDGQGPTQADKNTRPKTVCPHCGNPCNPEDLQPNPKPRKAKR